MTAPVLVHQQREKISAAARAKTLCRMRAGFQAADQTAVRSMTEATPAVGSRGLFRNTRRNQGGDYHE